MWTAGLVIVRTLLASLNGGQLGDSGKMLCVSLENNNYLLTLEICACKPRLRHSRDTNL